MPSKTVPSSSISLAAYPVYVCLSVGIFLNPYQLSRLANLSFALHRIE
jgi:hypothetical protein